MPNYPTHARWGRLSAAVAGPLVGVMLFVSLDSVVLAVGGTLGAAVATFVGAVFPDIDHHRSIPRRKGVRALRVLVVLGIASVAALEFETLVGLVEPVTTGPVAGVDVDLPPEMLVGATVALVALAGASVVDPVVGTVTRRHRGWTHSPGVLLLGTVLLAGGVVVLTEGVATGEQLTAIAVVGTFFLGCLVHLGLDDELW